ncbi:MAG: hypothetical protein IKM66_02035 [Clostridia bacterium]|nr:hypothetical protein [Clostridia bacterium]
MSDCNCVYAQIQTPQVNAATYPTGPRGNGIKSIEQHENLLTVTYDNGKTQVFELPDWWFGTRAQYNALSADEKKEKSLYFIEEGS